MKKILLIVLSFFGLLSPVLVKAQFTVPNDTVYYTIGPSSPVPTFIYDDITDTTSSSITLTWHVLATSFPTDWLTASALGICDNQSCRYNTADTVLWRVATSTTGNTFTTLPYTPNVAGNFDLSLNFTGVSTGTHWVTVAITDGGTFPAYTKNVTFIITNAPLGVTNINTGVNDIVLYPNPARDELNIVYNANADIVNVVVYNIIGKVMMVYKVLGNSANLSLENIPSGIYFVRLTNSHGEVVTMRKFTKQ